MAYSIADARPSADGYIFDVYYSIFFTFVARKIKPQLWILLL